MLKSIKDALAARRLEHVLRRLSESPEDPALCREAGATLGSQGRYEEAVLQLRMAVAADPTDGRAWYLLGCCAGALGNLGEAHEALERAAKVQPSHGGVPLQLAWVLMLLKRYPESIDHASTALKYRLSRSESATAHGILGKCHDQLGQDREAREHYEEALRLDQDNPRACTALGANYHEAGRTQEGMRLLERAVRLAPDDPDAWYALGFACTREADYARAQEALQHALQLGMDEGAARHALAFALSRAGDYVTAIEEAERALGILEDPDDLAELHANCGYCCSQVGQSEKARSHYEEAVRLAPENPEYRYNLGLALTKLNSTAGALHHLQEAVKLDPDCLEYQAQLASCQVGAEMYAEAEQRLRQLRGTEVHDRAHILLSSVLIEQGRDEEAIALARAEVEARPDVPTAWISLARVLQHGHDVVGSQDALARARSIDPDNEWLDSPLQM